jgi:predicted transcriptional regulator
MVERERGGMAHIGAHLKNIELVTNDPVARGGFTQVPNFLFDLDELSFGARIVYAKFLQYAWHNDRCFPGQDRLAQELGCSRARVTQFVKELQQAGLIAVTRRGLGKTNIYKVRFQVTKKGRGQGQK